AQDAYGGSSLQTTASGATATWRPLLLGAGSYEVQAWWGHIASADSVAQYTVKSSDGLTTVTLNQSAGDSGWVSLGTFNFNADRTEYFQLQRAPNATGATLADAVQFINRASFDLTNRLTMETWVYLAPDASRGKLI